ncbi:MAG: hypothetical protein ACRDRO_13630 [Pseudonocardiaceae bacterium]
MVAPQVAAALVAALAAVMVAVAVAVAVMVAARVVAAAVMVAAVMVVAAQVVVAVVTNEGQAITRAHHGSWLPTEKADTDHGLAVKLPASYPLSRARAITMRWIWLVPS